MQRIFHIRKSRKRCSIKNSVLQYITLRSIVLQFLLGQTRRLMDASKNNNRCPSVITEMLIINTVMLLLTIIMLLILLLLLLLLLLRLFL